MAEQGKDILILTRRRQQEKAAEEVYFQGRIGEK